jgi:hypothetical protein
MCLLWILYMYTVPRGGTGVVSLLWSVGVWEPTRAHNDGTMGVRQRPSHRIRRLSGLPRPALGPLASFWSTFNPEEPKTVVLCYRSAPWDDVLDDDAVSDITQEPEQDSKDQEEYTEVEPQDSPTINLIAKPPPPTIIHWSRYHQWNRPPTSLIQSQQAYSGEAYIYLRQGNQYQRLCEPRQRRCLTKWYKTLRKPESFSSARN